MPPRPRGDSISQTRQAGVVFEMRSKLQPGLPRDLERQRLILDGDVFPEGDIPGEIHSDALNGSRAKVVIRESAVLIGLPVQA